MEREDSLWQNKRPVRVLRKSIHVSLLTRRINNLFVERLQKDKETDKDVDADRDKTKRPVVSGQPTRSSTQLEKMDIDFGLSGLPHAVVKQTENSSVRELVKMIESHPHRQDLQANLQQSNAYKPILWRIKEDDSGHGQCRAIWVCETIPKMQSSECLLYWNQGIVYCTCGHHLRDN